MSKREIIKQVLEGREPPYVPRSFSFTQPARLSLETHYGSEDALLGQ